LNQKSERLSAAVLVLLKPSWTVVFVMLLLFGSTLPLAAAASPKSSCPGAGKTLLVVYLQPNTNNAAVGATILITVGVTYTDFSTVTLSPQTVSFRWVSTAGEKIVENVPVTGSGAGLYKYEQKVGDDFPTGTVTIFVLACSCSDGKGNYGPNADTSSDTTYREEDNSKLEIGAAAAAMQQPATQELFAAYSVPIVIAIVVIVALLLLVLRTRKKKK